MTEGCTPNEESTEWTCVLKPDLRWSDGESLTADDVAFTYRFVIDLGLSAYTPYFPFDPTFEAVDDRTLIWRAEQPTFAPTLPPYVYILPEHIWGQYEGVEKKVLRTISNTPAVGSGPFTLVEWKQDDFWRLERNPYWRGPEPDVDEIIYDVYTNEQAMVQDLIGGQLDAVNRVNSTLASALETDPNIEVRNTVSDWWLNLAFNFGNGTEPDNLPALGDLAVRRAIAHAIDRAALTERTTRSRGRRVTRSSGPRRRTGTSTSRPRTSSRSIPTCRGRCSTTRGTSTRMRTAFARTRPPAIRSSSTSRSRGPPAVRSRPAR